MTYTSKLKVGQDAWRMQNNKPVCQPVESVHVEITLSENAKDVRENVRYGFRIYDESGGTRRFLDWVLYLENQCFATKAELLASL